MAAPRAGAPAPAAAGFTLIEMLVVLAILAGVAALSGPVLSRIGRGQALDAFGETLAAQLSLTRAAAIRSNAIRSVALDPAARSFASDAGLAPLPIPADLRVTLEPPPQSRVPAGLIRFLPDGRSSGGQIRLEQGADTRLLGIERLTGSVHLGRADTP
ncbi:MAG TPA: GspH/FimT family pseudopilin [Methylobacterium sp.]|jgi:general secretion pathway protein H|nr:GspH/FimT family pseudopilin [Methylobacterium sp.]